VLQTILFGSAAAGLCVLITPVIRRWAIWLGALDRSGGQRIHAERAPRLGGLAVFIAFWGVLVVEMLLDFALSSRSAPDAVDGGWLLVGSLTIMATGVADDLWDLPPGAKLATESSAGILAIVGGFQIAALVNPFTGESIVLGFLSLPATLLWIVGITNAFNLIDGLDGLATGIALIVTITIGFIAATSGQEELVLLTVILAGALAGFLAHNFHPATIFLGDSGSLFLGYVLSVVSIEVARMDTAGVRIAVPIVMFALPITDLLLATARRFPAPFRRVSDEMSPATLLMMGFRSMLRPDRKHIHHWLLKRGFSHRQAVLVLYGVCALSGAIAVLLLDFP
jgi:UDP-GlcNAc:undecaprenyl-phosphate GlcNAc-1-phosphate transferase